eukprot:9614485-Lingulodinium_polyedra.AAC.1
MPQRPAPRQPWITAATMELVRERAAVLASAVAARRRAVRAAPQDRAVLWAAQRSHREKWSRLLPALKAALRRDKADFLEQL